MSQNVIAMPSVVADTALNYHQMLAREIAHELRPLLEARSEPKPERRLFTVPEAAEYIGRSETAVRLLINRGRLPVTKIDGKVQIDRRALDRLIDDSTYFKVD